MSLDDWTGGTCLAPASAPFSTASASTAPVSNAKPPIPQPQARPQAKVQPSSTTSLKLSPLVLTNLAHVVWAPGPPGGVWLTQ